MQQRRCWRSRPHLRITAGLLVSLIPQEFKTVGGSDLVGEVEGNFDPIHVTIEFLVFRFERLVSDGS